MPRLTTILYKCKCHSDEQSVFILERKEGEDVMDFMKRATEALSEHHTLSSPQCKQTTMEYAKIEVGEGQVGKKNKEPS